MSLPGFTAASSLYRRGDGYAAAARFAGDHDMAWRVVPQDCCDNCLSTQSRCYRACERSRRGPRGSEENFACLDRCSFMTETCFDICDWLGGCQKSGQPFPGGWPPAM